MEFVPCWNMIIVGISLLYIVYINASIYLVKGGRLGLMPGVLFHSCRPSFRHTGVMFLDFCVPYAVGCYGNPLTVGFEKTPAAKPNLGFNIFHLSLFPLGSADSRVIFILSPPPGPVLLWVLVQNRAPCGTIPWQLGLRHYSYASFIRCALRTRYVQLLSGFVGTSGWLC